MIPRALRSTATLALLALAALVHAAVAADPSPADASVALSEDPAWADLTSALSTPRARHTDFEERRFFPFRREPLVLQGEIRIDPARGLSLHYLEPKPQMLIVDDQGVLMRDEKGRQRAAPSSGRAQRMSTALTAILRFDLPALEQEFAVQGERHEDDWEIRFEPIDDAMRDQLGTIIVHGVKDQLNSIEMRKSASQRIEIRIQNVREDVTFTADELATYFR